MRKKRSVPVKPVNGRPTRYCEAHAKRAHKLALLGLTDLEMARFFEVAESTFHLWKRKHPEFSESLKRGKEHADTEVAESLYKAAIGDGVVTETKVQTDSDGNVISSIKENRQIPPSVSAMIFWLKNRQRDKWRDRFDHEAEIDFAPMDFEALSRKYEETMAKARARQEAVLRERGMLGFDSEDEA